MVAWVAALSLSHAGPVDLTAEVPTGSQLQVEETFSLVEGERREAFEVTGQIEVLAGGRLGDVEQRWRYDLLMGEPGRLRPVHFVATHDADGARVGPIEGESGPLDDPVAFALVSEQFRLLPSGRHRKGRSWDSTVQSAFFGGPLELTWTLDDVSKTEATVSVSGAGTVGREQFDEVSDYTVVGTVVFDRTTRLPVRTEGTWTLTIEGRQVAIRATRRLSPADAAPVAPPAEAFSPVELAALLTRLDDAPDEALVAFRAARRAAGSQFGRLLPQVLGTDLEVHYWVAAWLTSESYLQGDEPDPLLALTVAESALALVSTVPERDQRIHLETKLRFNATKYAWRAGLRDRASLHKSRFEALYATGESAAEGSVPASHAEWHEVFESIPTVPIPPVVPEGL